MSETPEYIKHGNNPAIKFNMLSDDEMRRLKFCDSRNGWWRFHEELANEVTLTVYVAKDAGDWFIDVIDEDFCQHYDYQHLLECSPTLLFASKIRSMVNNEMLQFVEAGLISNWQIGDYI